jgi:hypothetical protein
MQLQESPYTPSKSGNSSPLTEGRKEVLGTTTRTLKRVTYPVYPLPEEHCWGSSRKKIQNTNYRGTRD